MPETAEIRERHDFAQREYSEVRKTQVHTDRGILLDENGLLQGRVEEMEAKLAECEVAIKELALEATTAEDLLELAEMKLAEVAEKCIKVHKRA